MRRRSRYGNRLCVMVSGWALLSTGAAHAEDVPLATYYASPRGAYEELRVYDNALLALVGGQVGIGTSGGTIRALLDVHGEAAAQAVGLAASAGTMAQIWWLGDLSGADAFVVEGWDTIRGNHMPDISPPRLGGVAHPSVTIAHADGHVGVGDFTLPAKAPTNRLDIKGAVVVGAAYAGQETAPADGLLVEGATGISLSPGLQVKNALDVGGRAVIGSGYVGSAAPPANSLLVEGAVGVGMPPGTALANKLEVGGPAVIGAAYAGTVDVGTASATFTANLGIQRESRTTKMIKAPADGYPKAWLGGGGSVGGDWAFGVLDATATAGAITNGTDSFLEVCAGDCLGGGASTTVFSASSTGIVSITNSASAIDTLELKTTTTPKLVGLKPGARLTIPHGAANNFVLTAEDASGKGVWRAPTTAGLRGNAGASPLPTTASRPEALLFFGAYGCNSPNRLELLFEADSGSFYGCVGTAP